MEPVLTHRSSPAEGVRSARAGRASDVLVERLAALIASGDLAEGERLPPERTLMQRFGVSRSVVREAIGGLANRGLLTTRPRFRPVVRKPGLEDALTTLGHVVSHRVNEPGGMRDLFDTRIFLEAALARHAAQAARREDIEDLRLALEQNRAAIGHREAFHASDVAFHAVLYRIPGNPIYPLVHKAYVEWLMGHWAAIERGAEIDRLNHAGHVAIYEAIVNRDPAAAEAATRHHLQVAWQFVLSTFVGEPLR